MTRKQIQWKPSKADTIRTKILVRYSEVSLAQGYNRIEASYDKVSLRDQNKCPLYGIAGCPLLRGFECIEVYGNTIRTFSYIAGVRR